MANSNILAVVAIVFALIAAGIGGYSILQNKGEKGDIGDEGPQGVPGDIGYIGPVGEKGDKGDTGDTGPQGDVGTRGLRGYTGDKGDPGINGTNGTDDIDLEPNDAPIISVDDSMSYVENAPCSGKFDDFWFSLNITTNDIENDYRKIYLYYKWNEGDSWNYEKSWPYLSNIDYVIDWEERSGNNYYGDKTLYWLVECMDGENLVYLEGNTTLNKTICI